ncbi:phage-related tail protein [Clostridium moniliforme]|uniref:Phage-related tail protein n=1 Tax=Clostridium moniliforme TaxID=39489 RepID=A0ABS4F0Q3_9CLOT|nr:phage tail tape measure protein [Clostridium moniliforme]MBP1889810.1 phage-related tail protein [Clostridium moniliforme]
MSNNTEKRITAKMVLDDSGYSSTLKGINAELKNNQSALRATQSGLEAFGKTTENVSRVQENLQKQMDLQTKKVELYKSSINKANSTLEKSISERSKLKTAIEQEQAKLDSLKRTYGENNDAVRNSEKKLQDLQEQYDKTDRSIENNAKRIQNYETNLNKAQDQVNKTKSSIDKFNKSLENVDGFKSTKKRLEETSERFTKFGEKAEGLGNKLTFGVTMPIGMATAASFKLASDLNENVNKTDVVFKNNADTVKSWSKTSLQSMGMCQSSALEMASKFGDMSVSMGLNAKQTVKYSEGLTQLAADMASFKNISIERADEALTGVYTGETEALKSLGIVMTQTNLQRFAESKGIHKKIQDMSQAEQVQLRYNYVMSVTKDAQGDFARTSDQAANAGRTFKESTKELGATIGTDLLPKFTPYINQANEIIKSLAGMDQGTRDLIIKTGMAAMAVGPVVSGVGKLSKGIGGIIKVGSKAGEVLGLFSTASKVAGIAAEVTTVAAGGLGASLAGIALPVVGVVAGLGAVGFAAYKASEKLNESATPAVDLFADKTVDATKRIKNGNQEVQAVVGRTTVKISEATKKAVKSYLDLDKKASNSLMDLRMNSDKFTKDAKNKIIKNFTDMSKRTSKLSKEQRQKMTLDFKKLVSDTGNLSKKNKAEIIKQYTAMVNGTKKLSKKQKLQLIKDFTDTLNKSTAITKQQSKALQKLYKDMGDKIKLGIKKKQSEQLKDLQDYFGKSNALTVKEEADILKKTKDSWDKKRDTVDKMQEKINKIISKASEEHRQITDKEAKEIGDIQKKMKESAIKTLSDNEVQSKVILERMKSYDGNITAQQASEHIKELNRLRDGSVKAANDEYNKRIAEVIRMRDESKTITADQAEKLIKEAEKQRDGTIKAAEATRKESVDKILSMNKDIGQDVDTTTGNVLSAWQKFANWWDKWFPQPKTLSVEETGNSPNMFARRQYGHNWTGNSWFKGGYTTLHERGYELYDLPEGTRIYNHDSSEAMVKATAEKTAEIVAENILNGINLNIPNNNIPNITIKSDLHIGNLNEGKKEDLERMLDKRDKEVINKVIKVITENMSVR